MLRPVAFAALFVVSVLAAGCTSDTAPTPTIVIERSPTDHNNTARANELPHYHDYWSGLDTYLVTDQAQKGIVGFAGTGNDVSLPVMQLRPEPGKVVPQGTASMVIFVNWTNAQLDQYTLPELWVKTAADREPLKVAALESGKAVSMESSQQRNDLPHQVVSAWEFWIYVHSNEAGVIRYNADVHLHVTALRGLPIPLYPGHPDQWEGRTSIDLFHVGPYQTLYQGEAEKPNICLAGCLVNVVPTNGTIVPTDADHVTVWLNFTYGTPTKLGLRFHGADTLDWTVLQPTTEQGNGATVVQRVYVIPVGFTGDGPYAHQSQWEFQPFIEGPVADGVVAEELSVAGVVFQNAL